MTLYLVAAVAASAGFGAGAWWGRRLGFLAGYRMGGKVTRAMIVRDLERARARARRRDEWRRSWGSWT